MANMTVQEMKALQAGYEAMQRKMPFNREEVEYLLEGVHELEPDDFEALVLYGATRESDVYHEAIRLQSERSRREAEAKAEAEAAREAERVAGLTDAQHVAEFLESYLRKQRAL